jgi:hypothetical protein
MARASHLTRDSDLRGPLDALLSDRHAGDPEAEIWHEMTVCGTRARVDVAVVNGLFAGYEIKSGADTLSRLPAQARFFSRVFDEMTVVCDIRHLDSAAQIAPGWWGLWVATDEGFDERRAPASNPDPCQRTRSRLLWREEMLRVLARHDALDGVRSKPRRALIDRLVERLEPTLLADEIRSELRTRLRQLASVGV